ncbi:MAG: T9SS type A sorting domain-containing protein [Saprospiraceae bacterium]
MMNRTIYTILFLSSFLTSAQLQAQCQIFDMVATVNPCDGNFFSVTIDFQYDGVGGEGFKVQGNGVVYGNYNYASLPVTIGPLPGNGTTNYEFVAKDILHPDCQDFVVVGPVSCNAGACEIFDFVATPGNCNNDGTYQLSIDFGYVNPTNNFFDVKYNGTNIGYFELSQLPVVINHFQDNGEVSPSITVCINDNNDCCAETEFTAPTCTPGNCEIFDFVATPGDCNNDGTYPLTLNFQYINPGNNYFQVLYQGSSLGYFALADLPVTLPHFADNGNNQQEIKVCISDMPTCCKTDVFESPQCTQGNCHIYDMVADASDCEDGMFYVTIDFQFENVGFDGFDIHGNGINYGNFSYDDLPITLGPFAGNGITNYEFAVNDDAITNCGTSVNLGMVDCPNTGDCNITELEAVPGDCNNDGNYPVTINFIPTNSITNNFKVGYAGAIIASGNIANLPLTIHNFQDNGEANPVLTICMNDQPNCCATIQFEAPDCQPTGCHIYDLIAEAHPCNNDGQYLLDLDFQYSGVGGEGFSVHANGQTFGPFPYGQQFYTVGPLQGGVVYEINVNDNQYPDCHGFLQFGPVYCSNDCHIYDLTAETSDCDSAGQYFVTLDFEYANVGNDGFKVYGNGNVYGFFSYADLPVTIGPFPGNNVGQLEFGASDVQHPGCHDFVVVDVPNCNGGGNDCHIFDLVADVHPCASDGTFHVSLEFQHNNTGPAFVVAGNGISYGLYSYDDIPISIGPLVGNGTTPYEFIVYDLNHPNCSDNVNVGTVDCGITGDCAITDLLVDPGSCHSDGTYNLWLNFDFENATNNFFDVYYNGNVVGYFPLSSLPGVIIPHFHDDGQPQQSITVCINDNPNCCATATFESPDCMNPNVWPGDVNTDQLVGHFDILSIGLAYGATGPARSTQGWEWSPIAADNWPQYFANNTNFKHADCDGNGTVDKQDLQAILQNYGETHGSPGPPVLLGGTENDPPFFVDLPDFLPKGNQFIAPIMLGTLDKPVENLYGIAFTLNFDPEIIPSSSIDLAYDPSWLGVNDVNLLTFDKTFADEGRIEVALARSDQNDVSGYGQIAGFIGIIDNIAGKESMSVSITNVRAIQENEVVIPLYRPSKVANLLTSVSEPGSGIPIAVYPNPASDYVSIQTLPGTAVQEVQLADVTGKTIRQYGQDTRFVNLDGLASGVYILKIQVGGTQVLKRLVKQ